MQIVFVTDHLEILQTEAVLHLQLVDVAEGAVPAYAPPFIPSRELPAR